MGESEREHEVMQNINAQGLSEQDQLVEASVEEVMGAFFASEPQYENLYWILADL